MSITKKTRIKSNLIPTNLYLVCLDFRVYLFQRTTESVEGLTLCAPLLKEINYPNIAYPKS